MARMVRAGAFLAPAILAIAAILPLSAAAQIPSPPSTVVGSIADSEGKIPADTPVEAYVGDQLCGRARTFLAGEGSGQVTMYVIDVFSAEQTPGCGTQPLNAPGSEIRFKIGDRFAAQTARWEAGLVRLDITFGNATPAPIPSATPTPTRDASAPSTAGTPGPGGTAVGEAQPSGTIPRGSPGAGSPVPTLRGGVTSSQGTGGGSGGGDGGGGFPVWAIVVLVLGGIAAIGGGVGYAISRKRPVEDDYSLGPDS